MVFLVSRFEYKEEPRFGFEKEQESFIIPLNLPQEMGWLAELQRKAYGSNIPVVVEPNVGEEFVAEIQTRANCNDVDSCARAFAERLVSDRLKNARFLNAQETWGELTEEAKRGKFQHAQIEKYECLVSALNSGTDNDLYRANHMEISPSGVTMLLNGRQVSSFQNVIKALHDWGISKEEKGRPHCSFFKYGIFITKQVNGLPVPPLYIKIGPYRGTYRATLVLNMAISVGLVRTRSGHEAIIRKIPATVTSATINGLFGRRRYSRGGGPTVSQRQLGHD